MLHLTDFRTNRTVWLPLGCGPLPAKFGTPAKFPAHAVNAFLRLLASCHSCHHTVSSSLHALSTTTWTHWGTFLFARCLPKWLCFAQGGHTWDLTVVFSSHVDLPHSRAVHAFQPPFGAYAAGAAYAAGRLCRRLLNSIVSWHSPLLNTALVVSMIFVFNLLLSLSLKYGLHLDLGPSPSFLSSNFS